MINSGDTERWSSSRHIPEAPLQTLIVILDVNCEVKGEITMCPGF